MNATRSCYDQCDGDAEEVQPIFIQSRVSPVSCASATPPPKKRTTVHYADILAGWINVANSCLRTITVPRPSLLSPRDTAVDTDSTHRADLRRISYARRERGLLGERRECFLGQSTLFICFIGNISVAHNSDETPHR